MLIVAVEIAWLFVVLPLMEFMHNRSFQLLHKHRGHGIGILSWYFQFLDVLKRVPARDPEPYISFARKGLLYVALVLPMIAISIFASGFLSPLFVLGLMFCLGLIMLLMGFTFENDFIALSTLEQITIHQFVILIVAIACMVTPFSSWSASIEEIIHVQMKTLGSDVPAFGAFLNPIAFFGACFAIALYLRFWEEQDFPSRAFLRKPEQDELFGIDLVSFKTARSLEYLVLYSLVVFVFLGGPFIDDTDISAWLMLCIFTAKIFFVAAFCIGIHSLTRKMRKNKILRVMFLVLLPLEVASYPLSFRFVEWFNFH